MTTTTQIALLRAVNVGGTGKVAMAELRTLLEEMGFTDVRTLLQSGNVVLGARGVHGHALEERMEAMLLERVALRTTVIVRSAAEWKALVAGNPFADAARDDPGHLLALVTKRPVSADGVRALEAAIARARGRETIAASNDHVYAHFPDGVGTSKVTTAVIERALGTPVTGRNWNTVLKLAAMSSDADR